MFAFQTFYAAFNKTHSYNCKERTTKHSTTFIIFLNQFYDFLFFILDCIECQNNKHFTIKHNNISPPLPFYETAILFTYRISMATKVPISPSSQRNSQFFVTIDAFSHFLVTNPAPPISSNFAIQTLLHHWVAKFGPPQSLFADRGTE